jgi:hypothetical protein
MNNDFIWKTGLLHQATFYCLPDVLFVVVRYYQYAY